MRIIGVLIVATVLGAGLAARPFLSDASVVTTTGAARLHFDGGRQSLSFRLHEPSGLIGIDEPGTQLCEAQLLLEEPHLEAVRQGELVEAWLDARTGRLVRSALWFSAIVTLASALAPRFLS